MATQTTQRDRAPTEANGRAPDKPTGKPRVGGAARAILEWPDFDKLVEQAKAEAKEAPG